MDLGVYWKLNWSGFCRGGGVGSLGVFVGEFIAGCDWEYYWRGGDSWGRVLFGVGSGEGEVELGFDCLVLCAERSCEKPRWRTNSESEYHSGELKKANLEKNYKNDNGQNATKLEIANGDLEALESIQHDYGLSSIEDVVAFAIGFLKEANGRVVAVVKEDGRFAKFFPAKAKRDDERQSAK